MKDVQMTQWPVLMVSGDWDARNDDGFRLRELEQELVRWFDCRVVKSSSYEDALELFSSRADFGCVVTDWDIPSEDGSERLAPEEFLNKLRLRNRRIHVLLLTDRLETDNLDKDVLGMIDGCLWKTADTVHFLAGRIARHIEEYAESVEPEFFRKLVLYSDAYKYAWHTPGHLGGVGFLRSPAGVAFFKFFGENTLRSDLSISVPELGSLLDHEGAAGDAEKNSARVFGADYTYYVLNGTSTVNQIIWRSQLIDNEIALVDRNCHKSLNYAMVITGALPVYMIPRRNRRGTIGPVPLSEFSPESIQAKIARSSIIPPELRGKPKMSALTNSTYDGICYNVGLIRKTVAGAVENLHFDEAWYAYAKFGEIYQGFYGMTPGKVQPHDPPVFCSQSTHKLLTAFSQASMLHIRNGGARAVDPVEFNESYMMHGSTSPQYSMIASLDVATKMMEDDGAMLIGDIVREAVQLRVKMASLHRQYAKENNWFFSMWQPHSVSVKGKNVPFEDVPVETLANDQKFWVLKSGDSWHGFGELDENYVMLDPIKLTILMPGVEDDGAMASFGIPASIVSNYLIRHNIVCEKTDYYSFLLLNSLGTTRAKQGTLLAALTRFKELHDANVPLEEVFPDLVAQDPARYGGTGLAEHCAAMHNYIREHHLLDSMQAAFEVAPTQAMKPAEAYHEVVRHNVEPVWLDELTGRTAAVMLVPYPPGIPIMMGGEVFDEKASPILDYLRARQDFERAFPGYEGDIHGIERGERDGRIAFRTLAVKK